MAGLSTFTLSRSSAFSSPTHSSISVASSDRRRSFVKLPEFVGLKMRPTAAIRSASCSRFAISRTGASIVCEAQETAVEVKKQVFISVSDKTDLAFLGNELQSLGYTIVSTGETASALENVGVSVTKVELQLASFLELVSLSKRDQLPGTFEIVVANLYENVTSDGKAKFSGPMEDYDVEGISIITAAAKCYKDVLVVVDPRDYVALVDYLKGGGQNDILFGQRLAAKAFKHSSDYDSAVAEWMKGANQ